MSKRRIYKKWLVIESDLGSKVGSIFYMVHKEFDDWDMIDY